MNGQTFRLAQMFRDQPNVEIPAPELHRAASGKQQGYCGSLSRRISDLRMTGMNIEKTRDEYVGTERHTAYTYVV
mgnify:CR=1 FL=1